MAHGYGNSSWGDGADGATHLWRAGSAGSALALASPSWSCPASLPGSLAWKSGRS